ncbi:MAG: nucleotide sugar dehydrogenase [Acidobacteriota bacterium]|nr:nucleotide sugar dehydrogenase [Acidobacteriota bacterium]
MRILVWGLGHPGLVSAACLAQLGHEVIGIDIDEAKVATINSGCSPYREPGLAPILEETVRGGKLRTVTSGQGLISEADVSFISVGTPPTISSGSLDTSQIERVAETIANELQETTAAHQVLLRSTVPWGFTRKVLAPRLEKISRRPIGTDLALAVCPEFLREGNALEDFGAATFAALGTTENQSAGSLSQLMRSLPGEVVEMSAEEAEMLKLMNNSFHALKIGFANEMGRLCTAQNIDSKKLMSLLSRDTRLNISSAYLSPGFAFGGPCLPKDVAAIATQAREAGMRLPILESILRSNDEHFDTCVRAVRATGHRSIGILGLGFKSGSDDLRNSPSLRLAAQLRREGYSICAYDPEEQPGKISESNRRVLEQLLPEYQQTFRPSVEGVLADCSLIVVTQRRTEFALTPEILKTHGVTLLDLAPAASTEGRVIPEDAGSG